jgi:hypothetical protein
LLGGEVLALEMSRHDVGVLDGTVLQLDGKTGITDQSSAGNDGSFSGGMAVADGKFVFDGTDDYITLTSTDFAFGVNDFTIAMWVKTLSTSNDVDKLVSYQDTGLLPVWQLRRHSTAGADTAGKGISLQTQTAGSYTHAYTSVDVFDDTEWHHVVAVRVGTAVTFYIDGSAVASAGTVHATLDPSLTDVLAIGNRTGATNEEWGGEMDDIRILNRALSAAEVTNLYNNDIKDESGSGNDGTLTNGAYVGEDGEIVLDGVDDYVDFPNTILRDIPECTVSAWVNVTSISGTQTIFNESTSTSATNSRVLLGVNSDGTILFAGRFNDSVNRTASSTGTITAGNWHLVTGSSSSVTGDIEISIDGVLETFARSVDSIADTESLSSQLGAVSSTFLLLNGSIRDARIFDRALSVAEILFLASSAEIQVQNTRGSVLAIVPSFDDWGSQAAVNAVDFSGQGNVGTLTGDPTYSADTDDGGTRAIDYDGVDDYTIVSSFTDRSYSKGTASIWFKSDKAAPWHDRILSFGDSTDRIEIILQGSGNINAWGINPLSTGTVSFSLDSGTGFNDGAWHNVVVSWDESNAWMWVNGIQVDTDTVEDFIDLNTGQILAIGVDVVLISGVLDFEGSIDDTYIWDRVLSLDEIKALASTRNYFDCPVIVEGNLFSDAIKMLMGQTH